MAGEMRQLAQTVIGQAISAGDIEGLKSALRTGEDVHFKDRKGNTYLHYVCTMYRPNIFHILVAAGIDINAQNRHGNTALHVTAVQVECCHVGDLMACGIDPFIRDRDGKMASEVGSQNKYWHMIYEKYKPGIFQAIKEHDVKKVLELLHCWCRVDAERYGQTMRQYAAALKFHDIVRILDEHRPTLDAIYGVMEVNIKKVKEAIKKSRCDINFTNKASQRQHILQHAVKLNHQELVAILCAAGADVNLPVLVNNYFWGPLYFEALNIAVPAEIMWKVLRSGANFKLKDERGRTAMIYALDRGNGLVSLDVFTFMLQNGAYIADRDDIGVTVRDVARFNRRRDVLALIDKYYIRKIRTCDMECLKQLAIDGYDGLLINFNYRDSFIYASGNEADDVVLFVEWLPEFQNTVSCLHQAIEFESIGNVTSLLEQTEVPDMLLKAKNKAGRTPLIQAVLFDREDIVEVLLAQPQDVGINAKDNCDRTAYHIACALGGDGDVIREKLLQAGANPQAKDTRGRTGEDFLKMKGRCDWLQQERMAKYGMELELMCIDKYEELRTIIRGRRKTLKDFTECIKYFSFPVSAFPTMLSPLVPQYRDLIFLAVDYGKEDIACRLADLGADLTRTELYKIQQNTEAETEVAMSADERASHLGMSDLSAYLTKKRERQQRQQQVLLPKRAQQRFEQALSIKPQTFFITQIEMTR